MNRWLIGIDVGGSQVKAAACDALSGEVLARHAEPTRDGEEKDGLPAWAWAARRFVIESQERLGKNPAAIGVACPGLAAKDHRSIASMPGRLSGLEGFDWPSLFRRETGVTVLNDTQAALLGEVWQGAAKGLRHVILITLGTGVGGAILSDGWLLHGANHRAGHIGHISLDPFGPRDITGIPGSLEDAVGEATLAARTGGRFRTTAELLRAVTAGDADAARTWEKSVRALGCGLASLVNVLDPEAIVIGGGIAQSGPLLYEPLQKVMDEVEWRPAGGAVRLLKAEMGEWAGAVGAAWFALSRVSPVRGAARMNHRITRAGRGGGKKR